MNLALNQGVPQESGMVTYKSKFSKHLRIVKVVSRNPATPLPQNFWKTNNELTFKKYYGKNVGTLLIKGKPSSMMRSNRYKSLKTFGVYFSTPGECPSRAIKHLKISYSSIVVEAEKPTRTIRTIAQYKHLTSLEVKLTGSSKNVLTTSFYRRVRMLNHLKSLILTLPEALLLNISKYILSMKSLKIIKLSVVSSGGENRQADVRKFYSKLIKSQDLEFLKLHFLGLNSQKMIIDSVLRDISKTNIPSFRILMKNYPTNVESHEYFNAALTQSDLLTVNISFSNCISFNTNRSKSMSLSQAKRRLELQIILFQTHLDEDQTIDSQSNALIKNLKQLFANSLGLVKVIPKAENIADLRKLSVDFKDIDTTKLEDSIRTLITVLRNSNSLEHLNLYNIALDELGADLKLYESLFQEISNFKNLETLEMFNFIVPCDTLSIFTTPLQWLLNLKNCYLEILLLEPTPIKNFSIIFPESGKLTELNILLPIMEEEAKITFIKMISSLKELQILIIFEGLQFFAEDQTEAMFLETLINLKKLREIDMEDRDPQRKKSNLASQNQIKMKESDKMRSHTEKLFRENRNLEKIYFYKSDSYEIKYKRL